MNSDFKDLLAVFRKHEVKHLIVGGYAVMYYTEPRFTKDIDIFIEPSTENSKRVFAALKEFGAPLSGLTEKDFTDPENFYMMGVPPTRFDVLMKIDGVDFSQCWANRVAVELFGEKVSIISKADLIINKSASGRPQDQIDLQNLKTVPSQLTPSAGTAIKK